MKPRPFAYHAPNTLEEVLGLLTTHAEEAKILAGGQSLVPMLNFRLASPAHLIDINGVAGLDGFSVGTDGMSIGATVRQRSVERSAEVAAGYPVLSEALGQVAHVQVRNRGTVCGSLAHADASAELPAVMLALDAEMVARSAHGERRIAAADFFEFHLGTALAPDELLTEVRVPPVTGRVGGTFVEVARRAGDFALVGAAVHVERADDGRVSRARIVCSGVAPVPQPLAEAAQLAMGSDLGDALLLEIDQLVRRSLDPPGDVHASASYRKVVAGTLVRRALAKIRDELEVGDA